MKHSAQGGLYVYVVVGFKTNPCDYQAAKVY